MDSPVHPLLIENFHELQKTVQSILKGNIETRNRNHMNDMRTLALLKALTGEIVRADPASKARMHLHLEELILLHGNDSVICDGIASAIRVVVAA